MSAFDDALKIAQAGAAAGQAAASSYGSGSGSPTQTVTPSVNQWGWAQQYAPGTSPVPGFIAPMPGQASGPGQVPASSAWNAPNPSGGQGSAQGGYTPGAQPGWGPGSGTSAVSAPPQYGPQYGPPAPASAGLFGLPSSLLPVAALAAGAFFLLPYLRKRG